MPALNNNTAELEMFLHPNITVRRNRQLARATRPAFTVYTDEPARPVLLPPMPATFANAFGDIMGADDDADDKIHPNITVRVPPSTKAPNLPALPKQLHVNVSVRKPKPEVSPIGKRIIELLREKNVAKLFSYIQSTRLFEDCKNNVKLMSSLRDQYYHIPIDVWFSLTGITVQMWKELTSDIKNASVLGGEMNPSIYILKPDTQIRTEVLKCPLF